MKILDSCKICGQKIAKYSCSLCGANVCESCYDKSSGTCIKCKQGKI